MGTLYLVATPIGNLEDITLRALRVLKEVDLIAAEDTRRTRILLQRYGISTPLTSYHPHNWREKAPYLLGLLSEGKKVALVSDAGMPGISDPGEELVKLALARGIEVVPLPGPSAALTALVVSGLPCDRFVFEGFLPRKGRERRERLEALAEEVRTIILYEAPHRLLKTLEDLKAFLGDRLVAIARELTKKHETVWRGNLSQAVEFFQAHPPRGEITLVVGREPSPSPPREIDWGTLIAEVKDLEGKGWERKRALKEVARRWGVSRRDLYKAYLESQDK